MIPYLRMEKILGTVNISRVPLGVLRISILGTENSCKAEKPKKILKRFKMKTRWNVLLIVVAIFLAVTGNAQDQSWVQGQWDGYPFWSEGLRTLEVTSAPVNNRTDGIYGIAKPEGMVYEKVSVEVENEKIVFQTKAKTIITMNKVSEVRMEGTFQNAAGRIFKARFWRNNWKKEQYSSILGLYQGQWKVGKEPPISRFEINFIEPPVATIYYSWSDFVDGFGNSVKGGYWRRDARVTSGGAIEFDGGEPDLYFRFEPKGDSMKGLILRRSDGYEVNSIQVSKN